MSNFKRGGNGGSRFQRGSGGATASAAEGSDTGRSASRGTSAPRGNRGGGTDANGKKFPFSRIASLTVPKKVSDGAYEWIMENLRGNEEIRLNAKVYLPKGVNSVTLSNDELMVLTFKVSDKDKDFVVGHVMIPTGEE